MCDCRAQKVLYSSNFFLMFSTVKTVYRRATATKLRTKKKITNNSELFGRIRTCIVFVQKVFIIKILTAFPFSN